TSSTRPTPGRRSARGSGWPPPSRSPGPGASTESCRFDDSLRPVPLGCAPAMPHKKTGELRKGDRVVAAVPLREVPEGTGGRVMLVAGLGPWMRSWVQFENGIWMGSISNDKLVRKADWADFQVRRAEEAERAKNAPPE